MATRERTGAHDLSFGPVEPNSFRHLSEARKKSSRKGLSAGREFPILIVPNRLDRALGVSRPTGDPPCLKLADDGLTSVDSAG